MRQRSVLSFHIADSGPPPGRTWISADLNHVFILLIQTGEMQTRRNGSSLKRLTSQLKLKENENLWLLDSQTGNCWPTRQPDLQVSPSAVIVIAQ